MKFLIAVILVAAVIIYLLRDEIKKLYSEKFSKVTYPNDYIFDNEVNEDEGNEINEDLDLKLYKINKPEKNYDLKPFFIDVQFHTDYRDTITAFNDIAPEQKLIFNQANLPAAYSTPAVDDKYVMKIVKQFIKEINQDVLMNMTDTRQSNSGWDDLTPDPNMKSGWDKYREDLDLPTSIYNDPSKRARIKLIKVDNVEKFVTEFETKYDITIIIQKVNVEDQMIVKFCVVKSNVDVNFERKMFKDLRKDYNEVSGFNDSNLIEKLPVEHGPNSMVIEEIFVIGFLSNKGGDMITDGNNNDTFYNFKALETSDIIDQKTVMNELIKKERQRIKDTNKFKSMQDDFGREFDNEVPELAEYNSYKCTRSIFDDLSNKPIIYD